eukprot:3660819-Pleurochrysis_carterae.AAC.1
MSNCNRHCIAQAQRRLADASGARRRHRCDKGVRDHYGLRSLLDVEKKAALIHPTRAEIGWG